MPKNGFVITQHISSKLGSVVAEDSLKLFIGDIVDWRQMEKGQLVTVSPEKKKRVTILVWLVVAEWLGKAKNEIGTSFSIVILAGGAEGDGEVWWLGAFRWRWRRRSLVWLDDINGGDSGVSLVEREKRGVSLLVRWFHQRNTATTTQCWPERKKRKGRDRDLSG
ncbi:hypothetical protein HAX54_015619 [Datura stramonium]|uniref:Uncharacterized protein n=1 Tax=Datura stramonium TaxID=4076 RepID=A0ABS8RG40_DATST|nr:hypothetical protein [Datura stramonium]